ncbi:DEAD/DEAH box helicase [Lewinella sp. W8]|uniref:DEAD/DEAH box helicase n=1 Tax=Lewinella sp. W8 TaxID=2528208 RepID=UPI0015665D78|nr:DEAD/DEAH box helicase [Lewinella sp. W8]
MADTSEVLFNFFEFRTGIFLPKAYVASRNTAGRLVHIHQTARPGGLGIFDISPSEPLERALQLADSLREKNITEVFRKGAKKVPTLAGLLGGKERENVIRHIHHRTSEMLTICRAEGIAVTLGLDPRKAPHDYLVPFHPTPPLPRASFSLHDGGMDYRLILEGKDGQLQNIRYQDVKVITNHPIPGWIVADGQLYPLTGMNGDQVRPFLSRDTVQIPSEKVSQYWREFVIRVAKHNPIQAEGFTYREVLQPDRLRIAARPHPFEGKYYLYPEFLYGKTVFPLGGSDTTAVDYTARPPYRLTRIVRNPEQEAELLQKLTDTGLQPVTGTAAMLPDDTSAEDPHAALRWLTENGSLLESQGIEVTPPEIEGQVITTHPGSITITSEQENDWLDLKGTVEVGPHRIPFAKLVRFIQRNDPCFPLPDGSIFLIPQTWFSRYRSGLQFARVEGRKVRLARSQAPLLQDMGVSTHDGELARTLASAYQPSHQLKATLRPYQLRGARWLVRHYHEELGACLADDMGLGKTLQTIAVLLYAKERLGEAIGSVAGRKRAGAEDTSGSNASSGQQMDLFNAPAADEEFLQPLRALIVLPASLVFNWRNELQQFAPSLTVATHTGTGRTKDARVLRRFDVLLTTYQTALRDQSVLEQIDFTYIVLDESQQIKNRQSKVFRSLNELSARHRISLSGTPIENSLSDLWSQMQFINPGLLRNYAFFKKTFITPIEQRDDEEKKAQLRKLVSPHLLRRTKEEVAPDLPELDVQQYYCEMSSPQRKRYEQEVAAARNALLGAYAPENGQYKLRVIQTLTRLRQLANHPVLVEEDYTKSSGKFDEVIEQWETVHKSGHKVLIFSSMVSHLELFRAKLEAEGKPFAWITGQVSAKQRAVEVTRFQENPEVQTFFISIKAGGTGLNLTAADYVFILDPWWNPSTEDQAIARAHRIGRKGNVFARKFLTKDTIEEKINRLQARKKQLSEDIIGDGVGLDFDREELRYLLG